MLRAMSGTAPPQALEGDRASGAVIIRAVWIDLEGPTEDERAEIERCTGQRVPDRGEIAEIENSSRLVNQNGVLILSTPMIGRDAVGALTIGPIGFVVAPHRLITIRYAGSMVFDRFADHWRAEPEPSTEGRREPETPSGMQPFLGLLEALVDRLADGLEQLGADLDKVSSDVFHRGAEDTGPSRRRDAFLRATLTDIGRKGTHISQQRDALLGIGRIARFVQETAIGWLHETDQHRLKTIDRDITSLNDYDAQLTNKIQFLLDATLGFINIEQNNTIKVLTVVSIVGIPPTFVASLYGMNFKNMPELGWTYGYEWGLSLITLSVLIPLLIFWRRGWL